MLDIAMASNDVNTQTIVQPINDIEILHTAALFKEKLLTLISTAKERILLSALYLQDDEAGREVLTALYEAKGRNSNLDVVVLVDWHRAQRGLIGEGQSNGNADLYKEFSEKYQLDVKVIGVPVSNREVFGVLHLKGFIIDNTVIYSGASINNVYLGQNGKYRFDRYHVFKNQNLADSMSALINDTLVKSDAVNSLSTNDIVNTKSIKHKIKKFRRALTKASYKITNEELAGDNDVTLTPLLGIGKRNNQLNNTIENLILNAESEITILTPYFNPPKSIIKALKIALDKGIKVNFVVGDKTANDFYIRENEPFKVIGGLPYLYETNLRTFAKSNNIAINNGQLKINIWKDGENTFHLKGVWVDRKLMLITGNNLNPRAWKLDLENGILINDSNKLLESQYSNELDNILLNTSKVAKFTDIDDVNKYPEKIKKLIGRVRKTRVNYILTRLM